jgi:hypothetical protein
MRHEMHGCFRLTACFNQRFDFGHMTVHKWFVRIQVAVPFRMMRAGLRAPPGTGAAGYAADKKLIVDDA